jgi:hypothetical protein
MTQAKSIAELKKIAANQQEVMSNQERALDVQRQQLAARQAQVEQQAQLIEDAHSREARRRVEQAIDFVLAKTPWWRRWLMSHADLVMEAMRLIKNIDIAHDVYTPAMKELNRINAEAQQPKSENDEPNAEPQQ